MRWLHRCNFTILLQMGIASTYGFTYAFSFHQLRNDITCSATEALRIHVESAAAAEALDAGTHSGVTCRYVTIYPEMM